MNQAVRNQTHEAIPVAGIATTVHVHRSRCCNNCAHFYRDGTATDCAAGIDIERVDDLGSFRCHQHQTDPEHEAGQKCPETFAQSIDDEIRHVAFGGDAGDKAEQRGAALAEWLRTEFIDAGLAGGNQGERLRLVIKALDSLDDGPFPSRAKAGFAVRLTAWLDYAWNVDGARD